MKIKSCFPAQLIGEKLEDLDPRAAGVLTRSETVQPSCTEEENEAVKKAISKFRLRWNNLNQVNGFVLLFRSHVNLNRSATLTRFP